MRKTIIVDGFNLNLVMGMKKSDYMEKYGEDYNNGNLWDFPIEELLDGTIDINEDICYWLINGRCYEAE